MVVLVLNCCFVAVAASSYDFVGEFEELAENIKNSPDDCWKRPAEKRKEAICSKLNGILELVFEGKYNRAYKKLLYDVKPKLTGLKTDENEDPWGFGRHSPRRSCSRGWFCGRRFKAWVKCEDLKEGFRLACNSLLAHIKIGEDYDDDSTGPLIAITYDGEHTPSNPGKWEVKIEDPESGIDEVRILINESEYLQVQGLDGALKWSYDVPVPALVGINTIVVTATNNDKDFVGDQEISSESEWVEIYGDSTPPEITHPEDVEYLVESAGNAIEWIAIDENPDNYAVLLDGESYVSGTWESETPIVIDIDGLSIGTYEFVITVYDAFGNNIDDTVQVSVHEVDDTPPIIRAYYVGGYAEDVPGHWKVELWDEESGLGEIYVSLSFEGQIYREIQENLNGTEYILYKVPLWGITGTHFLNVVAKNDVAYDGVQETSYIIDRPIYLAPYIPPEPNGNGGP